MKMQPVKSSNISHIGHDGQNTMHVTFKNGATYQYKNVSTEMHSKIVNAESIGSALNKSGLKGVKL